MVFISLIVGYIFARSISRPINKLTAAGNEIGDGKLDTELPEIKSRDEIKELSDTMNILVGAIRFLKKEQEKKVTKKKKK